MLTLLLLLVSPAFATCDAPSDVSAISVDVSAAQLAMAGLDMDAFNRAVADARATLACLATPLNPLEAAAYHGLMGLDAFMAGNEDAAVRSFQSAVLITPDFRLPPIVAPAGGPLDAILAKARVAPVADPQALPPFDGIVLIDGNRALVRPMGRPVILQLVTQQGTVSKTYDLGPSDGLPRWDPPPTGLQRILPKVRDRPSVPLAIAAGTTAIAAGTLYGLGGAWHAEFEDPSTPYESINGLQTQTNVALGSSIALGVAAATLTTLTFLRW